MARERILIVEDERITGLDICETVRELGYESIGPVAYGTDAIAKALAHRPDAILMDIHLKGSVDGIEAAEVIRSQSRCPVIYVTALSDELTRGRARITEPIGCVLKPIDEQKLRAAIEKALHQPKMEEPSSAWPPRSSELVE